MGNTRILDAPVKLIPLLAPVARTNRKLYGKAAGAKESSSKTS
jgi:hypothetical protein